MVILTLWEATSLQCFLVTFLMQIRAKLASLDLALHYHQNKKPVKCNRTKVEVVMVRRKYS